MQQATNGPRVHLDKSKKKKTSFAPIKGFTEGILAYASIDFICENEQYFEV